MMSSYNFDTPKTNLLAKYDDEFAKYATDPKYAAALTSARKMALDTLPKDEKAPSPAFDNAFSNYEDLIIAARKEKAFGQLKQPRAWTKWIVIIVAIIIVLLAIAIPLIIYFKKEHARFIVN